MTSPVDSDGLLDELIIGDDYLIANERDLVWSFPEIVGFTTSATGKFGIENSDDSTETYLNILGVVTDLGYGIWSVSFEIAKTELVDLLVGTYNWSVEITEGATEIVIAYNRQEKTRINVIKKYT